MLHPVVREDQVKQSGCCISIATCPMAIFDRNGQFPAEISKAIGRKTREDLFTQPDGTNFWCLERLPAGLEVVFDKGIVEVDVMGYKHAVFENFSNFRGNRPERRRFGNHFMTDS